MASSAEAGKNKKPKGRLVQSKYKQSAEKYTSQCSDQTVLETTKFLSSRNLNQTKANQTLCKKKFSTPATNSVARPNFDASMISNASIVAGPKKAASKMKTFQVSGNSQKSSSLSESSQGSLGQKKKNAVASKQIDLEDELDICYAEYQLSLLLENKARKGLQEKSKTCLEKIYEVFSYLQVLLGKHESIKKELLVVSFLLKLHEHSAEQEKVLTSFLEILPQLEKQYEEIASAVDVVRHKLPLEDVILPQDSENKIIELVTEIGTLLNDIVTNVGDIKEVDISAEAASAFVKKGKLILDESKRGSELLNEARNLVLSETSLKFSSPNFEGSV